MTDPGREDDWRTRLRATGRRLTPQRELVLRAVDELRHATPDEVLAHVRRDSASLNISTVYRTLELLESLGLVRHAHLTDRAPTYHAIDLSGRHEHFHLVCRGCGDVISVDAEEIEDLATRLREERGFRVDTGHLTVFGWCGDCEAPEQVERPTTAP
ncbi:transcriptional repressor [Nocardioidaceae bacterium]|nr:transcriptional repressor [Nocardioidaceae bacterium]